MNGVIRTRVGYAGGQQPSPTYRRIGDHTETLQIDFDPTVIDYETLIWDFWNAHVPTHPAWSTQYMNALFYHSDAQKEVALRTRAELEDKINGTVRTLVAPAGPFYLAEDYHQKYSLQSRQGLMKGLRAAYPTFNDFVNSTAAARLNGIVSGYGDPELVKMEVGMYGLSEMQQAEILNLIQRGSRRINCG